MSDALIERAGREAVALRRAAEQNLEGAELVAPIRCADLLTELGAEIKSLREERDRLRAAILWALGEGDYFPDWPATVTITGNPKFWWRKELRKRAALGERWGERE